MCSNQFIHFIGVPIIMFGILLILTKYPFQDMFGIAQQLKRVHPLFEINLGTILSFSLFLYYILLHFGVAVSSSNSFLLRFPYHRFYVDFFFLIRL